MNRWLVEYRVDTILTHKKAICFSGDGWEVSLEFPSSLGQSGGGAVAMVIVQAENWLAAHNQAHKILARVLAMISLRTLTPAMISQFVSATEWVPTSPREHVVMRRELLREQRELADAEVDEVSKALTKSLDEDTYLSLRWLNRAMRASGLPGGILDRFVCLWLSTERLARSLPGRNQVVRECKKCGHKIIHEGIPKQKLRDLLMTDEGQSEEEFQSTWKLRQKVFHGAIALGQASLVELLNTGEDLIRRLPRHLSKKVGFAADSMPWEHTPTTFELRIHTRARYRPLEPNVLDPHDRPTPDEIADVLTGKQGGWIEILPWE